MTGPRLTQSGEPQAIVAPITAWSRCGRRRGGRFAVPGAARCKPHALLPGRLQLPQAQADTVEILAPEGRIARVEIVEEQGVAATVGVAQDHPGAAVAR